MLCQDKSGGSFFFFFFFFFAPLKQYMRHLCTDWKGAFASGIFCYGENTKSDEVAAAPASLLSLLAVVENTVYGKRVASLARSASAHGTHEICITFSFSLTVPTPWPRLPINLKVSSPSVRPSIHQFSVTATQGPIPAVWRAHCRPKTEKTRSSGLILWLI